MLHISDLHCAGASSSDQLLRPKFFEEYIRALCERIASGNNTPDLMIVTGDFSHKCEPSGFSISQSVINLLCKYLPPLSRERVLVCPGNHDYVRSQQEAGNFQEARTWYYRQIAAIFGPPDKERRVFAGSSWGARITISGESSWVLSLDSTWGNSNCLPGWLWTLSSEQQQITDDIVEWVREIPSGDALLILSHYPIHLDDPFSTLEGEEDFRKHHLAGRLENLRRRIRESRRPLSIPGASQFAPTLWFYGDVHKPRIDEDPPHYHLISGRLDSPIDRLRKEGARTAINRSARVVNITKPEKRVPAPATESAWNVTTTSYSWRSLTHKDSVDDPEVLDCGEWRAEELQVHRWSLASIAPIGRIDRSDVVSHAVRPSSAIIPKIESEAPETIDVRLSVFPREFDSELSEAIIEFVRRNRLLRLERHPACSGWERLTHIDLGPILNDMVITGLALWAFREFIQTHIRVEHGDNDTVIVGVDVWGCAIAADMSVRTGLRSIGMTLRGNSDDAAFRSFAEDAEGIWTTCRRIILVSDVVVTGETLRRAHDIAVRCRGSGAGLECWALVLICPSNIRFRIPLEFLAGIATACSSMPLTLAQSIELPDSSILRPITPV